MRMNFNTSIKHDGNKLRLSVPATMSNKRFEAYYAQGQIIIAEAKDKDSGIKPSKHGTQAAPSYYLVFGKKWIGNDMPRFKMKTEVSMENGQFTLHVPEQDNHKVRAVVSKTREAVEPKRTYVKKSERIAELLRGINKGLREEGEDYEIETKNRQITFVKRIG